MDQGEKKQQAARAAGQFLEPGVRLGVGTGSTVNFFIDELASQRERIAAVVASSRETEQRLKDAGFEVSDLSETGDLDLYVDGADEANKHFYLIKGGGGALTREKVIAAASRRFVCIIDDSKWVAVLGHFPLPIEVIPMAQSYVARQLVRARGQPILRKGVHREWQRHPGRPQSHDHQPTRARVAPEPDSRRRDRRDLRAAPRGRDPHG